VLPANLGQAAAQQKAPPQAVLLGHARREQPSLDLARSVHALAEPRHEQVETDRAVELRSGTGIVVTGGEVAPAHREEYLAALRD